MHQYNACGFAIGSDLPLPMAAAERAEGSPLVITEAPAAPQDGTAIGPFACAGADWIAFEVPGLVRFHVTCDTIRWQPGPGADLASIATFALNSALPCAAMLAGIVPLRGTCVTMGKSAVLLIGAPAAGKSAVAAELLGRGHGLLSDGTAYVARDGLALPGVSSFTLSRDTIDALELQPDQMQRTRPGLERYHWPQAASSPRPVNAVYQLVVHTQPEARFADIRGAERLAMLRANAFRPGEHQRFGLNETMLQMAATLSAKARFRRVWRPVKDLPIAALADRILADLQCTGAEA